MTTSPKSFLSEKVAHFSESVIREMFREAVKYQAVTWPRLPRLPRPR